MSKPDQKMIRRAKRLPIINKNFKELSKSVKDYAAQHKVSPDDVVFRQNSEGWNKYIEMVCFTPQTPKEKEIEERAQAREKAARERERKERLARDRRRKAEEAERLVAASAKSAKEQQTQLSKAIITILETDPDVLKKVQTWEKRKKA